MANPIVFTVLICVSLLLLSLLLLLVFIGSCFISLALRGHRKNSSTVVVMFLGLFYSVDLTVGFYTIILWNCYQFIQQKNISSF